jgi:eukaryotic-like serine/threonine-protein kinase
MSPNPITAKTIFLSALDIADEGERRAFVAAQCGEDHALRRDVERLLYHDAAQGSFLEPPAGTATADSSSISENSGAVIGPYKLLEQIGEGGFGVVFMAEQTRPVQRKVALKVIKPGMDSKQVIARFEAERQALAMMDHINIARVIDGGTTEADRPYFVMELVHGVPITKYCDDNHLTPRERLELFVPVCHAIQHAHQKGIIHRDVKPSNVMVTLYDGKPVPKVIDFGVAKATEQKLTERTLFTNYGTMVGTLEYMSPEQAEMSALGVDTRSDIYSLGVLLYELLTGSTPLSRKRVKEAALDEILRIIKEEEPPKPSARLSNSGDRLASISANRHMEPAKLTRLLRGELDWIVMKCLEKDRNRRYETANGFAMDVQRYLADEPVMANPPSARYRLRKFVRKNRVPVSAAFLAILALLAGIVGTTVGLMRAEQARKIAVAAQEAEAEQRRTADEERAIAQAVNDFVQVDLLGQVDIGNQPGGMGVDAPRDPNIKVRTVLDRAARKIEGRFANQPRVEAAIRLTIAKAYLALGNSREFQRHVERSAALLTAHLGADHVDTLVSKDWLVDAYKYAGMHEQAEALCRETLDKRMLMLGPDHPDTLASKNGLASIYMQQGKLDLAEPLRREVVQKRVALLGAHDPDTLYSKTALAWMHFLRGNHDLAESQSLEVIKEFKNSLGEDHPGTLLAKSNLAIMYGTRGKYVLAEPLYLEVLEKRIALQGPDHCATLGSKVILGSAYREQRKFDLAVPLLKEALEASKASQGKDSPTTLNAMRHLGLTYIKCNKHALAVPLFEQMLAIYKETPPQDEFDSLIATKCLAGAYLAVKMPEKALPLFRKFIDGQRKRLGADSPEFAGWLNGIGHELALHQQYPEAEGYLREYLAIPGKEVSHAWNMSNSKSVLGVALMSQKKYTDAEPLLRAGYEGLKRHEDQLPKESKVLLTNALRRLVRLYEIWGRPDEAAKWRAELTALRQIESKTKSN